VLAHSTSRFAPWLLGAALAVLAISSLPRSARAYEFVRVGDGSAQSLTWSWATTFGNCTSNGTCGDVSSVDGKIPPSYYQFISLIGDVVSGGMLDWSASQGQLRAVAVPWGWAQVSIENSMPVWTEGTATVDARTTPLVFQLVAESGDPSTTNLRITPRLDGGAYLLPRGGPGSSTASLELFMSVDVDGQQVSRDSLVSELANYPGGHFTVAFPKGAVNIATVMVSSGAEVTVRLWAFERVHSLGNGTLTYGESSYGQSKGPAIIVDVQTLGTTDVGGAAASSRLRVGARPNPFSGAAHIFYSLPRPAEVRLSIYDLSGARVATLVERREEVGSGEITWSGKDSRGMPVAPGMYFIELVAGHERAQSRLVVLGP